MAVVVIPTVFQGPTRGESRFETDAQTVGACFDGIEARCPGLKELVIDPQTGAIHKFVKVMRNGELLARDPVVLETKVSASDEIEVIAAVAGG